MGSASRLRRHSAAAVSTARCRRFDSSSRPARLSFTRASACWLASSDPFVTVVPSSIAVMRLKWTASMPISSSRSLVQAGRKVAVRDALGGRQEGRHQRAAPAHHQEADHRQRERQRAHEGVADERLGRGGTPPGLQIGREARVERSSQLLGGPGQGLVRGGHRGRPRGRVAGRRATRASRLVQRAPTRGELARRLGIGQPVEPRERPLDLGSRALGRGRGVGRAGGDRRSVGCPTGFERRDRCACGLPGVAPAAERLELARRGHPLVGRAPERHESERCQHGEQPAEDLEARCARAPGGLDRRRRRGFRSQRSGPRAGIDRARRRTVRRPRSSILPLAIGGPWRRSRAGSVPAPRRVHPGTFIG